MIIKLYKNGVTTDIGGNIFYYDEDEFGIHPNRRKKVRFLRIKHNKDLNFLGTLELRVLGYWDTLRWHKKQ